MSSAHAAAGKNTSGAVGMSLGKVPPRWLLSTPVCPRRLQKSAEMTPYDAEVHVALGSAQQASTIEPGAGELPAARVDPAT